MADFTLTIPHTLYQALVAHARSQLPLEACGLLRGREGRVTGFLPAQNIAATPRTDYQVDPESLLRALSWEDEGDELMAIFHSHPSSPPRPSLVDVARALYPDSVYLILSFQDPTHPQLQGFTIRPEGLFRGAEANALRQGLPFQEVRPGLWGYAIESEDETVSSSEESLFLVYDHPDGPVRLMHVRPVTLHLTW